VKRTPLARRVGLVRTKSLRFFSRKRERERPERLQVTLEVVERDGRCMYPVMVRAARLQLSQKEHNELTEVTVWKCRGHLVAHEPAHRRNVDYLDPVNCIALCTWHNAYVEQCPQASYAAGLLVKGNGLPLTRHRSAT
jgi:hypothetical protein